MTRRHFSIRDLLWLTALCAVLVAWWMDHEHLSAKLPPRTNILPQAGGPIMDPSTAPGPGIFPVEQ
jgi:hypothetical protein